MVVAAAPEGVNVQVPASEVTISPVADGAGQPPPAPPASPAAPPGSLVPLRPPRPHSRRPRHHWLRRRRSPDFRRWPRRPCRQFPVRRRRRCPSPPPRRPCPSRQFPVRPHHPHCQSRRRCPSSRRTRSRRRLRRPPRRCPRASHSMSSPCLRGRGRRWLPRRGSRAGDIWSYPSTVRDRPVVHRRRRAGESGADAVPSLRAAVGSAGRASSQQSLD